MPNTPIFQMRLDPAKKERWGEAARSLGMSLAEWITTQCDVAIGGVAQSDYPAAIFSETAQVERKVDPVAHGEKRAKLARTPSPKKAARQAAAESARESVVVPPRRGEMVDVKMATPNLAVKCPHGHRFGEPCYKCDPKRGLPNFPEQLNAV